MKRVLFMAGFVAAVVAVGLAYSRTAEVLPQQVVEDADAPAAPTQSSVEITYIANEGILLTAGDTRVLIDGLFREYQTYPFLPQPHQDRLETAAAPFDSIDLILVSHKHGDHFHPASVARYLQSNSTAQLVSSEQVVNEIQSQTSAYAAIASRVTAVTPPLMQKVTMTAAGIQLEVLGLGHGTGRHGEIQNLGHIVTIGGKKLLHVGDANPDIGIFETFNLDQAGIDIAFLPIWFLTNAADLIREHIRPKQIFVVHMARGAEGLEAEVLRAFPEAVPFTRLLEKRHY